MKLLSRPEELILLAIWKLKDNAYCVPIREQVMEMTGKKWSFGSIYIPLNRLEEKGLINSLLAEPTRERGGRAKRYYNLTKQGKTALEEIRELQQRIWIDVPDTI